MSQSTEPIENHIFKRKPRKCPVCGVASIANILYGMPVFNPQLERKLAEKKVILGGCVISDDDPSWGCTECESVFFKEGGAHKFLS